MTVPIPEPWGTIAAFQSVIASRARSETGSDNLNVLAGREDALTTVVDEATSRSDPRSLWARFRTLCRNRTAKYRRQRELAQFLARCPDDSTAVESLGNRELVELVRSALPPSDWTLLWEIAEGRTGPEVASRHGLALPTLRSRLRRARERARGLLAEVVASAA